MKKMTSADRVFTTMDHEEPDRVPFTLNLNLHSANLLNVSLKEYFSKPEYLVKGQLYYRKKYEIDVITSYHYSSLDLEAFGGESIFYNNGPPNAGKPIFNDKNDILNFDPPDPLENVIVNKVTKTTELLKEEVQDKAPILGIVTSPFSLPIMQMGLKNYLDILYDDRDTFKILMKKNEKFVIEYANLQLEAGADAIAYSDPMSSPALIPRDLFLDTGFKIAKKTIDQINGNVAVHHASARTMEIINDLKKLDIVGFAASSSEDLSKLKEICKNELTIMGNLNGVTMRDWTPEVAEKQVRDAILKAGKGGGFILTDTHGEIPYQVPEIVIEAISKAVKKYGKYPLEK